jgi:hypothetical protein
MTGADRGDHTDENGHGGLLSPVSLALGVLSGGIRFARELPETAAKLPVRGLNLALTLTEKAQHEAASIQHRGMQLLDLLSALRGGQDDVADVDAALARARANIPDPGVPATVADLTERAAQRTGDEPGSAEPAATGRRGVGPAKAAAKPTTKRPAAGPRQPAKRAGSRPDLTAAAVDAGAPGAASDVAARAEEEVTGEHVAVGAELSAAELPLTDFDQLSIGSLRSRLPRLGRDELVQLLSYERAHARRLQVVTMIENRIAKVEHDAAGATTPPRKTARKAPAKKAASPSTLAGTGGSGTAVTGTGAGAAEAEPGGSAPDEPVTAPDADAAQDAAEDFGSNSPHP